MRGILELGLACLPWSASLREWRTRVACLRAWCPEINLPDLGDEALVAARQDWLAPLVAGCVRVAGIDAGALAGALHARLDYAQQRALDEHAPTTLAVPSGMRRALQYAPDAPPVLAVKLQEMFGQRETPAVGGGKVPVVIHLLSPAGRPLAVTGDLPSFWTNAYPSVRKEMRGRYPKHPWPEDPLEAVPTHRTKRRD
jgi:ATP-dependent helicase HrpB